MVNIYITLYNWKIAVFALDEHSIKCSNSSKKEVILISGDL